MLEFMGQYQMYVVLTVVLLVWAGIVSYLFRLDRKISALERKVNKG